MAVYIKRLIGAIPDCKLEEFGEVIEYLSSLALDPDTDVNEFKESLSGFFEDLEVNDENISMTLDVIRNPQSSRGELINEVPSQSANPAQATEVSFKSPDEGNDRQSSHDSTQHSSQLQFVYVPPESNLWVCNVCTYENNIHMVRCEMCGENPPTPRKASVSAWKKHEPTIETPINALNLVLQSDARRRKRGGEHGSDKDEMLDFLSGANVSNAESCRKLLERNGVSMLKLKSYSFDEFVGFGLSFADATCLFDTMQQLNQKPAIKFEEDEECSKFDATPTEVNELMFLIPNKIINRAQVEYIYTVLCRKSIEVASLYLVENLVEVTEMRQSQNVRKLIDDSARWWEEKAKPIHDEEDQNRAVKDTLIKRFDERPDDSKVVHRPSASYGDVPKRKGYSSIRYLDGNKVNMKNAKDKFIVEDTTIEWDGGSRGKVKTKGKRGPGFVSS